MNYELARKIWKYNPTTGIFHWTHRRTSTCPAGSVAGSVNSRGYISINYFRKMYKGHRLAWLMTYGHWPPQCIDHINGNGQDNRIDNLRSVSVQENARNSKLRVTNTSGVFGVCWRPKINKWRARITISGRDIHLIEHSSFFEAVCARKSAEVKFKFHKNHGRLSNE